MIVKLFLCVSLFFTYPVMMFPVTRLLETRFLDSKENQIFQQNLLRLLLVSLTGLIVILVPNFANLMAFIGATCCTLLAFILPGLFHFFTFRSTITKWECVFDCWLILFGLAGSVIGTQDALQRMMGFQTTKQYLSVNSTNLQVSMTH
ncbi:amino acid transporter AVT3B-like [Centruroides sculpturatus]|uniref:amino acid transporter AVT3B-like n=1 Tax=Centruroides sculpturatus TaxID=218467 RepID=UPI000C6CD37E|nr:amino acid transporter AVT3B-like [Centruroides sculpturatus]